MNEHLTHVGIDVAKEKLDIYILENQKHRVFKSHEKGVKKAVDFIAKFESPIVAIESTGGYENAVVEALHKEKIDLAVLNPQRVKSFGRGIGQLAKTDKADAKVLATYAKNGPMRLTKPRSNAAKTLDNLTTRLRQLTKMRTMEKVHTEHTETKRACDSIVNVSAVLDEEIEKTQATIDDIINGDPDLKKKTKLLETMKGIGRKTATLLTSCLPQLGTFTRQQIAAFVGVAPMNRDSGSASGKRKTQDGKKHIRTALYMPTVVAVHHNPQLKRFYDRLVSSGKPNMVAIIAAMRKIFIILNTMVANDEPWRYPEKIA